MSFFYIITLAKGSFTASADGCEEAENECKLFRAVKARLCREMQYGDPTSNKVLTQFWYAKEM